MEHDQDNTNEADQDDNMGVERKWYENVFADKSQKLPKCSKNEDKI